MLFIVPPVGSGSNLCSIPVGCAQKSSKASHPDQTSWSNAQTLLLTPIDAAKKQLYLNQGYLQGHRSWGMHH